MIVVLIITAILLTLVYLGAGVFKLISPKEKLRSISALTWVDDFSRTRVRLIAAVELLGALGVILPLVTGIAPVLTGIAALGLALVQLGAMRTHLRRKEPIVVNIVLLVLALIVAIARFVTL